MYIDENDNRTPRERVDDSFLRHMLNGTGEPSCGTNGCTRNSVGGRLPCNPAESGDNYRLMNFPLGMVYAPIQEWRNAYDVEKALTRGTLFQELDKPWEVPAPTGKGGRCCD